MNSTFNLPPGCDPDDLDPQDDAEAQYELELENADRKLDEAKGE